MTELFQPDADALESLAQRHGFSRAAIEHMHQAVARGFGGMAGFNHPEFGGAGQWMRGGMIMIEDAQNHALKARIDALCTALATQAANVPSGSTASYQTQRQAKNDANATVAFTQYSSSPWWPASLGTPNATGQQNDLSYAYFADARRLALRIGDRVTVHDTGEHHITGFSQQQSDGRGGVRLSSMSGPIDLATLPEVSTADATQPPAPAAGATPAPTAPPPSPAASDTASSTRQILDAIERLGELRDKGLLTDDEFATKKRELLDRL